MPDSTHQQSGRLHREVDKSTERLVDRDSSSSNSSRCTDQPNSGKSSPMSRIAANFTYIPEGGHKGRNEVQKTSTEDLKTRHDIFKLCLATYKPLNKMLPATSCAEAGFICKAEDTLLCVWCETELNIKGVGGVDMSAYHEAASSNCPFVLNFLVKQDGLVDAEAKNGGLNEQKMLTWPRDPASVLDHSKEADKMSIPECYKYISERRTKWCLTEVANDHRSEWKQQINSMPDQAPIKSPVADSLSSSRGSLFTGRIMNRKVTMPLTCKICHFEIIGNVYLSCVHQVWCVNCMQAMLGCPLCCYVNWLASD